MGGGCMCVGAAPGGSGYIGGCPCSAPGGVRRCRLAEFCGEPSGFLGNCSGCECRCELERRYRRNFGRTSCRGELLVLLLARCGIAPGPCGGIGCPGPCAPGGSWLLRRPDIGLGPGGPTFGTPAPLRRNWVTTACCIIGRLTPRVKYLSTTTHLILYRHLAHVLLPNPEIHLNTHEHLRRDTIDLHV